MLLSLGLTQIFFEPLKQHYSTVLSRRRFRHTQALHDLNADNPCQRLPVPRMRAASPGANVSGVRNRYPEHELIVEIVVEANRG